MFIKTIKPKHCNICGRCADETIKKRLVRDHNHTTGFIRGPLCDRCNIFLGTFESVKDTAPQIIKARNEKNYINWVNEYKERILWHLKQNTGLLYESQYQNRKSSFKNTKTR